MLVEINHPHPYKTKTGMRSIKHIPVLSGKLNEPYPLFFLNRKIRTISRTAPERA